MNKRMTLGLVLVIPAFLFGVLVVIHRNSDPLRLNPLRLPDEVYQREWGKCRYVPIESPNNAASLIEKIPVDSTVQLTTAMETALREAATLFLWAYVDGTHDSTEEFRWATKEGRFIDEFNDRMVGEIRRSALYDVEESLADLSEFELYKAAFSLIPNDMISQGQYRAASADRSIMYVRATQSGGDIPGLNLNSYGRKTASNTLRSVLPTFIPAILSNKSDFDLIHSMVWILVQEHLTEYVYPICCQLVWDPSNKVWIPISVGDAPAGYYDIQHTPLF